MSAKEEGETFVLSHLGVFLVIVLLGADPAAHQVIPHRVRQGKVVIPRRGHVPVLHQREVQVPVEAFLDLGHVSETRDTAHADLFALLVVAQRLRHVGQGKRNTAKVERKQRTRGGSPTAKTTPLCSQHLKKKKTRDTPLMSTS